MPQKPDDESLEFLKTDPVPVQPDRAPAPEPDALPRQVVDDLMRIDGVDGVWVEQEAGAPIVVLHYSHPGPTAHLPSRVHGMPTRIVGGEPIRAFGPR